MTVNFVEPPRRKSSVSVPARKGLVYRFFQNYYHGHQILNPDPSYICNVKLSLKHWQLKDLIQIDSTTGSLYHTSDDSIRIMLLKRRNEVKSREVFSLPYSPQCFSHAAGGILVAGGLCGALEKAHLAALPNLGGDKAKGLFSVYSPSMQEEMSFRLGDMINNAVTIYPAGNGYKSYVCNNDLKLYTVDVLDQGILCELQIVCEQNTLLNNVVRAPNGRELATTGDLGNVYMVDPRARACTQTIYTGHDSGFGLSFHQNGTVLAGAFQDGTCLLYDLRNPRVALREIRSSRPGNQSGAFRCCKFLPSSVQDLLVVSEDVGRVHVIDYKNLLEDSHQVIVFPHALDQFARHQASQKEGELKEMKEWQIDHSDQILNSQSEASDSAYGRKSSSSSSSSSLSSSGPALHRSIDIYDENCHFSAPLVYDYDYVTNVNPKLFKDFIFEPENGDVRLRMGSLGSVGYRARSLEDCTDRERLVQYHRYYHELYQQAMNHISGEMKISGIDWYENLLFVGGLDGGVLRCDVNVRARRSFGSFSYA